MKSKRTWGNGFVQGYACACAVAAKQGTHFDGQRLLKEGGFNIQSLADAKCEEADIESIFPDYVPDTHTGCPPNMLEIPTAPFTEKELDEVFEETHKEYPHLKEKP